MGFIEDFLDLQNPSSVRLSPDSQQVVYAASLKWTQKIGEKPALSSIWLAETGKSGSARQVTSGLFNDTAPKYSPDGRSIVFISDRGKAGDASALYQLPMDGGEPIPLTEATNERPIGKFSFSPDGKSIAFLSADEKSAEKKAKEKEKDDAVVWNEDWAYDRLRLLHLGTKTVTTPEHGDVHITDFAWNDDGTEIATIDQQTTDIESPYLSGSRIITRNLSTKETRHICHFPTGVNDLTWSVNTISFRGGIIPERSTSASAIYSVDVGAEVKEPQFQWTAHGKENCALALGKADKDVTVYVQEGMEDQLRILNGRTIFAKKQWIYSWDAGFTHNSDEMVIVVTTGDLNNPTEVYTTTSSGGALVKLSNHGHVFAEKTFGTCNFIKCRTLDDKEDIEGMYLTPATASVKNGLPSTPLPTAVVIHGGPYHRITNAWNPMSFWIPAILASGHGILIPNYRGSSGYGQRFAQYEPGGMGIYDQPDIIAMTQYAIEQGWVDKENVLCGGWSQGGYLSFLSSVRNGMHGFGWKFKAAIPAAGVTDWDMMTFTSDMGFWEGETAGNCPWRMDKGDASTRQGSAIWEFKAALEKGNVIPPMLIIHGEKDARVPLGQALAFRRALDEAHLPFEFVTYPREDHSFVERKHIEDMVKRVQRFVDTHLGKAV